MKDIFISFSSKDTELADRLMNDLESCGYTCWIAHRNAQGGIEYASSIVKAIKQCKVVLLLFSENSNASRHVLNEINSCVNANKSIITYKISNFNVSDAFEYYLGNIHWITATNSYSNDFSILKEAVSKYINSIENNITQKEQHNVLSNSLVSSASNCKIMTYTELLNNGYTSSSIAIQLIENDYINCNGIAQDNEGTVEQWEEMLINFGDTIIFLVNKENVIVGDFHFIALNNEVMVKAKSGNLLESVITFEDTEFIGFPGTYNGFILSIGILPNYRTIKNTMLLLNKWVNNLEELSNDGVFFKEWCINIFSKETEKIIRGMGFNYLCDNIVFGKIYHLPFIPLPEIQFFTQYKELEKNYAKYNNKNC